MSELRPYGRELLEAARREHTPTDAERARLLDALLAAAARSQSGIAPAPLDRRLKGPTKLLVLLAVAVLIAVGTYVASHLGASRR